MVPTVANAAALITLLVAAGSAYQLKVSRLTEAVVAVVVSVVAAAVVVAVAAAVQVEQASRGRAGLNYCRNVEPSSRGRHHYGCTKAHIVSRWYVFISCLYTFLLLLVCVCFCAVRGFCCGLLLVVTVVVVVVIVVVVVALIVASLRQPLCQRRH
jgi:hypothetical protein